MGAHRRGSSLRGHRVEGLRLWRRGRRSSLFAGAAERRRVGGASRRAGVRVLRDECRRGGAQAVQLHRNRARVRTGRILLCLRRSRRRHHGIDRTHRARHAVAGGTRNNRGTGGRRERPLRTRREPLWREHSGTGLCDAIRHDESVGLRDRPPSALRPSHRTSRMGLERKRAGLGSSLHVQSTWRVLPLRSHGTERCREHTCAAWTLPGDQRGTMSCDGAPRNPRTRTQRTQPSRTAQRRSPKGTRNPSSGGNTTVVRSAALP